MIKSESDVVDLDYSFMKAKRDFESEWRVLKRVNPELHKNIYERTKAGIEGRS